MFYWWITIFSGMLSAVALISLMREVRLRSSRVERESLRHASICFENLVAILESGLVPSDEIWTRVDRLPLPWSQTAVSLIRSLRENGSPIVPTIRRLKAVADDCTERLLRAKTQSAQASFQAVVCSTLIPIVAVFLFFLLEPVQSSLGVWISVSVFSSILALVGGMGVWVRADRASWGNLSRSKRNWILQASLLFETLSARLFSGVAPDIAWVETLKELSIHAPDLSDAWGVDFWSIEKQSQKKGLEKILLESGTSLKRSLQANLLEGRACSDQIVSHREAFRVRIDQGIEKTLALLSGEALIPLFLFVLPAVVLLLTVGLWLTWREAGFG